MEGIKILKRPKLRNPYLLVAWPGMGEVAFKAASYLVEKLKAVEFAEVLPEEFFYFTSSIIHNGVLDMPALPQSKFYYWKNPAAKRRQKSEAADLIIFLSNAQPDLAKAEAYSKMIIQLAKSFKVDTVIGLASMPQAIDHTQEASVWVTATSAQLNEALKKFDLKLLSEGQISGMNGLFLGLAKKENLKGFCLLGEIPLYTIQIENPRASQVVLGALAKIMNIQIDLSGLTEQAKILEAEINKLLDYLKLGPTQSSPINEEEIEKIKKTLSQLTKLPVSIKEKIEKLFAESKNDISRANELKIELDKWNVYREYEDRFLDLFKRGQDKNH